TSPSRLAISASEPPIRPTPHTVICLNSAAMMVSSKRLAKCAPKRRPQHRPDQIETSGIGVLGKSKREKKQPRTAPGDAKDYHIGQGLARFDGTKIVNFRKIALSGKFDS